MSSEKFISYVKKMWLNISMNIQIRQIMCLSHKRMYM